MKTIWLPFGLPFAFEKVTKSDFRAKKVGGNSRGSI